MPQHALPLHPHFSHFPFHLCSSLKKFAKWADKGTGINPFLPPRSTTSSTAAKAGGLVLSLGLLAVRLPLLCITGSWLFLVSLLTTPWFDILTGSLLLAACYVNHAPNLHTGGSPTPEQTSITLLALGVSLGLLPPLHRLFSLLLLRPALAAVLKTMGISFIEQHANLRKLGLRPPGHKPLVTRVGATIQPGDLLLSNHTSALDILYFASRSLPLFSCFTLAPEIRFSSLSAFGAVWKAGKVPNKAGQGVTLDKVLAEAKRERRSLVVFPEMVRSNGEGILAFPKGVLDGLAGAGEGGGGAAGGSVGVHLFGFRCVVGEEGEYGRERR